MLAKTIGDRLQSVLLTMTAGIGFMVIHQTGITPDKLQWLANSSKSPIAGATHYLFCGMFALGTKLRINVD